jgi:hypothetical protein
VVAGCNTTVPPLIEDGIAVAEIVQRVKCEIAFAVPQPQEPEPTGKYQWMRNWTAKAELTLKTNGKSSVTPSVVLNKIWPSFTLGLNAGLETTADRTDILSFNLSLAEMLEFKKRGECNLPDGVGLYGNLGLREWIAAALAPVDSGQLKVGEHAAPGAKSVPPPKIRPPPESALLPDRELKILEDATQRIVYYGGKATERFELVKQAAAREATQDAYNHAGYVLGAKIQADKQYKDVKRVKPILEERYPSTGNTAEARKRVDKLVATSKETVEVVMKQLVKDTEDLIKDLPHDPPISSISHSVNFVVELKGGMAPNWSLVSVRGPAASGNFLAGTNTRTHTLSIAMGHPAEGPAELARQLNNLQIIQSLSVLGVR